MKYNTRFNPTVTRELHVGHLYTAIVNATEARNSGGRFIVRIDDTQNYWMHHLGKKAIDQLSAEYNEQLSRFMVIDVWERQSNMPSPREIFGDNHPIMECVPKQKWFHDENVNWIFDREMCMFPYAPCFTFEKVAWDFYEGINWLIRGEDLITETCLYDFFAETIGIPRITHTYLPRLRAIDRQQLGVTTHISISKTFRRYELQKQIDRFGVAGTLDFLRQSCLTDTEGDFLVDNVKWNPVVIGFEE